MLELKAILFGLKSLCSHIKGTCIKVLTDNTTALHCVNNMGSCKSVKCDLETINIWDWAILMDNHLIASHIPGILNVHADLKSRENDDNLEWMLNPIVFDHIVKALDFKPEIDLFASRINSQVKLFVSFHPDTEAMHVNAFSLNWHKLKFYAFPPFSLMGKVLQKVVLDRASGIVVAPYWKNQPWFNLLMDYSHDFIIIPSSADLLYLPSNRAKKHPLTSLQLAACYVSCR